MTSVINARDSAWAGGASGDGVSDDTLPIQAALDAANASGKDVVLSAGTYIVSGLRIASGVRLRGAGIGATTIKLKPYAQQFGTAPYPDHRAILRNANANTTGDSGIVIEGLTFDGNATNGNNGNEFYFGIEVFGLHQSIIRDCRFQNFRGEGILLPGPQPLIETSDVLIENIVLFNCGYLNGGAGAQRQGIAVVSGKRIQIRGITGYQIARAVVDLESDNTSNYLQNCIVDGVTGYDVGGGVWLDFTQAGAGKALDNIIRNVTCSDGPSGALALGVAAVFANRTLIDGVSSEYFYNNQAVQVISSDDCIVKGVNCVGLNAPNPEILVASSQRTLITGCNLKTAASETYGVGETGTSDHTVVVGNGRVEGGTGAVNLIGANSRYHGLRDRFATVASAGTVTLPKGAEVVLITGTTTITSITAAAGDAGRKVTLIFAGILTLTDGSNLKLAGNFITTADDAIDLACDGTSWYQRAPGSVN